jgi:hypothetical protein
MRLAGADRSVHAVRLGLLIVLAMPLATHPATFAAGQAAQAPASVQAASGSLPARLSDGAFWKLQADISEPDAFFRITDNFTSNEQEVGKVYTLLREMGISGGVYLGVGPEQNYTYMAAIRPSMAFIVDIRRQAAVQHLMFKAIFEMAKDRAEFLSLLFSTPRPASLGASTPIDQIWEAFLAADPDTTLKPKTYARILTHLTKTHGFSLTADELAKLNAVFEAFSFYGPGISTRGALGGGGGGGNGATFADLTGFSHDLAGRPQSFLSTEDNYRFVKSLHERNLIVPVTGDFGGPKALREVGAYLRRHGAQVSAFYVSNVEQYLFQDGKNGRFYDNVATLPLSASSVFIRPYSLRRGGGPTQSLCAITAFLTAVRADRIYTNNDALNCGR